MLDTQPQQWQGVTRREFLGALAAGACAPAMLGLSGSANAQSLEQSLERLLRRRHVIRSDTFTRIFPNLPPFAQSSPALTAALTELGRLGGIMDAKDDLAAGPVQLIVDPTKSAINRDNPRMTAGVTFLGQFLDHDFTFDQTTRLNVPAAPERSPNTRTPALDLDTVYGGGPRGNPELYEGRGRGVGPKLRIESGGLFEDLPRTRSGVAIIGDPRNDENVMLAGIQAAMIKFHNNAVDLVARRNRRASTEDIYEEARRLTTWHYQWVVVNEFLPLICGEERVNRVLQNGTRFFRSPIPAMPVEFQGAVYRLGHSLVRPSYRANFNGIRGTDPAVAGAPFFGMIFDPAGEGQADPVDLRGGARQPRRFIGWQTFFKFDETSFRNTKRLDTTLSTALFTLPLQTIAGVQNEGPNPIITLPGRNLLRGVTWGIPSGQAIAREMGVPALTTGELSDVGGLGANLDTSTPLFFYMLREAQLQNDGLFMGDVGGTIVAEVFIQNLRTDRNSYLAAAPRWRPTLPDRFGNVTGNFTMTDLLTFAGVVDRGLGSPPTTL
jgi:hypothetical protein